MLVCLQNGSPAFAKLEAPHSLYLYLARCYTDNIMLFIDKLSADGLGLPVEEWQKAIQDQLEKFSKLESDYEGTLIARKVSSNKLSTSINNKIHLRSFMSCVGDLIYFALPSFLK